MNNMNMNTSTRSMPMNSTGMPPMGDQMMKMYFHTGVGEYILFETLLTSTAGEMVGACAAIFVLAMLYEGLKVLREHLSRKSLTATGNGFSEDATLIDKSKNNNVHMLSGSHFIQTLLHVTQVFVSYCLMLVFMTYNAWLCISVILGVAAGYFLFGWRRSIAVDLNEHCH